MKLRWKVMYRREVQERQERQELPSEANIVKEDSAGEPEARPARGDSSARCADDRARIPRRLQTI